MSHSVTTATNIKKNVVVFSSECDPSEVGAVWHDTRTRRGVHTIYEHYDCVPQPLLARRLRVAGA